MIKNKKKNFVESYLFAARGHFGIQLKSQFRRLLFFNKMYFKFLMCDFAVNTFLQQTQLSQTNRAMLHVTEYFAVT